MSISTWAVKNGLIQCMGCKGYGPSHHMAWHHNRRYGTKMPYCTSECREVDA